MDPLIDVNSLGTSMLALSEAEELVLLLRVYSPTRSLIPLSMGGDRGSFTGEEEGDGEEEEEEDDSSLLTLLNDLSTAK